MELDTSTLGIFQADVILRSAIVSGLADVRANPWLLDYIFASLKYDTLTRKQYGEKEIDAAKAWFLSHDVPVFMNTRLDDAQFPCISISLSESQETENTLSDVHYDTQEDIDYDWPISIGPFTPVDYDPITGSVTMDEDDVTSNIFPGMLLVDRAGKSFEILTADTFNTFTIAAGAMGDFTDATIRPARSAYTVALESAVFKESYSVGVHVPAESVYLSYLHPVVIFILLRYRQSLLEARGFERSSVGSGEFRKDETFDNEVIYSRFVQVTGFVRQYWPKDLSRKIDGTIALTPPIDTGFDATELDEDFVNHDSLTPSLHP